MQPCIFLDILILMGHNFPFLYQVLKFILVNNKKKSSLTVSTVFEMSLNVSFIIGLSNRSSISGPSKTDLYATRILKRFFLSSGTDLSPTLMVESLSKTSLE